MPNGEYPSDGKAPRVFKMCSIDVDGALKKAKRDLDEKVALNVSQKAIEKADIETGDKLQLDKLGIDPSHSKKDT